MGWLVPLRVVSSVVLAVLLVVVVAIALGVLIIASMLRVSGPSVAVPGLLVVAPVTEGKGPAVLTAVP